MAPIALDGGVCAELAAYIQSEDAEFPWTQFIYQTKKGDNFYCLITEPDGSPVTEESKKFAFVVESEDGNRHFFSSPTKMVNAVLGDDAPKRAEWKDIINEVTKTNLLEYKKRGREIITAVKELNNPVEEDAEGEKKKQKKEKKKEKKEDVPKETPQKKAKKTSKKKDVVESHVDDRKRKFTEVFVQLADCVYDLLTFQSPIATDSIEQPPAKKTKTTVSDIHSHGKKEKRIATASREDIQHKLEKNTSASHDDALPNGHADVDAEDENVDIEEVESDDAPEISHGKVVRNNRDSIDVTMTDDSEESSSEQLAADDPLNDFIARTSEEEGDDGDHLSDLDGDYKDDEAEEGSEEEADYDGEQDDGDEDDELSEHEREAERIERERAQRRKMKKEKQASKKVSFQNPKETTPKPPIRPIGKTTAKDGSDKPSTAPKTTIAVSRPNARAPGLTRPKPSAPHNVDARHSPGDKKKDAVRRPPASAPVAVKGTPAAEPPKDTPRLMTEEEMAAAMF